MSKFLAKLKLRKRDSPSREASPDVTPIPVRARARSLCVASEAGKVLISNGIRLATHAETCEKERESLALLPSPRRRASTAATT